VGTGTSNIAGSKRIDIGEAGVSNGLLTLRSSGGAQEANISCSATGLGFTTNSYATPFDARASEIIFGTGSSGTERMRITSTGLLGLGNSSPNANYKLDVAGAILSSSAASEIAIANRATNAAAWAFYSQNGEFNIYQWSAASSRLSIDTSGRVGIGSTGPSQKLDVIGNIQVGDSGNERGIYVGSAGYSGAFLYRPSGDVQLSPRSGFGITFAPAPGSATEWGRWDSSGRLLVGTSSARSNLYTGSLSAALQVEGTTYSTSALSIIANGSSSPQNPYPIFYLGRSHGATVGSNTVVQNGDEVGAVVFTGADGTNLIPTASIESYVDGTPGANDMPGRLVFSTTADGASSPTERMRINRTGYTSTFATTDGLRVSSAAAAGTASDLFDGAHSATAIDTGTISFRVTTNGNTTNTNNSYAGISDIKLKENIADANSQWNDLKSLQVRKYNFKEETGQQTHTQIGLVAQEVELVSPGLVNESPDRDAEGNDLGTVTKSVNYSVLYMKAVKALQEAMDRIEILEASNADILARLSALEGK
jgi:hypothetical protein